MPLTPVTPAQLGAANTLRLPCEAAALWDCSSDHAVMAALEQCGARGLRPLPLGEGSNVLLPPRLERGVLRSSDATVQRLDSEGGEILLRVGAGKNWHELVCDCLDRGWHGLENLALIPGTVGAAPVQNIGAYGAELADFVLAVHGVNMLSGDAQTLDRETCAFAYRDSVFKGALAGRFMITAVDFALSPRPTVNLSYPSLAARLREWGSAESPQKVFEAVVALRRERLPDPATTPNAGSFFKNPLVSETAAAALQDEFPQLPLFAAGDGYRKASAAWMIESCGFRGKQLGTAAVSAAHALVLVNHFGDRDALLTLAQEIREAVRDRFGCELELEPTVIERV